MNNNKRYVENSFLKYKKETLFFFLRIINPMRQWVLTNLIITLSNCCFLV